MQTRRFDAHYGRVVDLDLCHGCGLIWFDGNESITLTPGAILKVFAVLDEHRDQRHPLQGDSMHCPRCRRPLQATVDRARATQFSYWRCPGEEGRLTTFFDFLREKNFVRPLYAPSVNCSACGAPIDLARESACSHCRAPLSMLDPDQVRAVVRQLQQAETRRTTLDPTLAVRLLADRQAVEHALGAPGDLRALDLSGAFGVVEAGLAAFVRSLENPPRLSAP